MTNYRRELGILELGTGQGTYYIGTQTAYYDYREKTNDALDNFQ